MTGHRSPVFFGTRKETACSLLFASPGVYSWCWRRWVCESVEVVTPAPTWLSPRVHDARQLSSRLCLCGANAARWAPTRCTSLVAGRGRSSSGGVVCMEMTLSAWSTPRPSPTALLLSTLMWELLLLLLASVQGTGLGTKGTPVDPDRSGLTGPNGRRIPKVIQEPAMHHLLIPEVHDFLVDIIGLQPHQMCSHEGRRPSPRNRGLLEQQIVQNHVPMDQLQIRCYCHWSSNGPHGSLYCYSYMLSEQWGPLIFCCKGMHYRWKHHVSSRAIVGGLSGQLFGCVQTSGRHRESCWHGKESQRCVQMGRFNGVIQVVSPLSLCSSPMLNTLVGLKNLNLFSSEVWSHKGILESLSAFLMPCAIIETCSMAWLSCSRIPQATFWGLFWERCTIETLPNYLAWGLPR